MRKLYSKLLIIIILSFVLLEAAESGNITKTHTATPKILGGTESKPGMWPWIAALLDADVADMHSALLCGATLIDANWVLTAAHCVPDEDSSKLEVAVGVFDLSNTSSQRLSVKNIYMHPLYDHRTLVNDIALLELNGFVQQEPIVLFSGESREDVPQNLQGELVTAIGWGWAYIANNWILPKRLRQVNLPVVALSLCNFAGTESLISSQICAGYDNESKDVCAGDSGGPIVAEIDGQWTHIGLTSFGEPCYFVFGWYGVYTRTSSYVDFIKGYVPGAQFTAAKVQVQPKLNVQPWLMLLLN